MSVSTSPPPRKWRILLADQGTAAAQMAMDVQLAQQAEAVIRFFRWRRPAVSLGFKQRPPAWTNPASLARQGIDVVERPTGGGMAIHGSDVSFSVVAPYDQRLSLEALLEGVGEALQEGVKQLGVQAAWSQKAASRGRIEYCLIEESPYALMVQGRKLCGLAVRRYPLGWLVQGSLLARELPVVFGQAMPADVLAAFRSRAVSLEQAAGGAVDEVALIGAFTGAWRRAWE